MCSSDPSVRMVSEAFTEQKFGFENWRYMKASFKLYLLGAYFPAPPKSVGTALQKNFIDRELRYIRNIPGGRLFELRERYESREFVEQLRVVVVANRGVGEQRDAFLVSEEIGRLLEDAMSARPQARPSQTDGSRHCTELAMPLLNRVAVTSILLLHSLKAAIRHW
jgi:hypothetical protein